MKKLTIVSNTLKSNPSDNHLNKVISLSSDGTEIEKISHGSLVKGHAKTIEFETPLDFLRIISNLKSNQAVMTGIYKDESVTSYEIASTGFKEKYLPNAVTRTVDNFKYPEGPGVIFLDCDGHPIIEKPIRLKTFYKNLIQTYPALEGVEMLILPSSSAGIYRDGEPEPERKYDKFHVYLMVDDASKTKAFGQRLKYEMWKAGFGYIDISSDGKMLIRHLFDDAVYSPERLIFEARPTLGEGLKQLDRDHFYVD
jgi:hypothetical protein